jgi:hypothetical protein
MTGQSRTCSPSQSAVYVRKPFTVGTPCRAGLGEQRDADGLDRVYADRTAALALEIDNPGAGW